MAGQDISSVGVAVKKQKHPSSLEIHLVYTVTKALDCKPTLLLFGWRSYD